MYDENAIGETYVDTEAEYIEDNTTINPEVISPEVILSEDSQSEEFYSAENTTEGGLDRKLGVVSDLSELVYAAQTGDAHTILKSIEMFSKSQLVRFMDVTVLGPLMLYYAYKGKLSPLERGVLALIGAGTVIYNGRNFLKNRNVLSGAAVSQLKETLQDKI